MYIDITSNQLILEVFLGDTGAYVLLFNLISKKVLLLLLLLTTTTWAQVMNH